MRYRVAVTHNRLLATGECVPDHPTAERIGYICARAGVWQPSRPPANWQASPGSAGTAIVDSKQALCASVNHLRSLRRQSLRLVVDTTTTDDAANPMASADGPAPPTETGDGFASPRGAEAPAEERGRPLQRVAESVAIPLAPASSVASWPQGAHQQSLDGIAAATAALPLWYDPRFAHSPRLVVASSHPVPFAAAAPPISTGLGPISPWGTNSTMIAPWTTSSSNVASPFLSPRNPQHLTMHAPRQQQLRPPALSPAAADSRLGSAHSESLLRDLAHAATVEALSPTSRSQAMRLDNGQRTDSLLPPIHHAPSLSTSLLTDPLAAPSRRAVVSRHEREDSRSLPALQHPDRRRDMLSDDAPENVCPTCGVRFASPANTRRHMRTVHLRIREHPCQFCSQNFLTMTALKDHVRSVHLQERPFSCDQCGHFFARRSHLNQHIKTVHEQQRSFVCRICNRPFMQQGHLNAHLERAHQAQRLRRTSDVEGTMKDDEYPEE